MIPRNISFMLTTGQIQDQSKTVTRRVGWEFLNDGDVLNACVKCMGLKKGESIEKLCQIRVINVRNEPLDRMIALPVYGKMEAQKEGFPEMTGGEFVDMFCKAMKCHASKVITRIEFEYLPTEPHTDDPALDRCGR